MEHKLSVWVTSNPDKVVDELAVDCICGANVYLDVSDVTLDDLNYLAEVHRKESKR